MRAPIQAMKERAARWALLTRKNVYQTMKYARGAERHVFVAGVQRSGTNMVMDVLEKSFETAVFHETDRRAFSNYLMRDEESIRRLATGSRSPVFVVKALCESQRLRGLLDEFEPAKGLWVFRHFDDVVNSMLRSFQVHALHIERIAGDRNAAGWRGEGISDDTHALIQRFARPGLEAPTAAALMWYLRNVLFFEQGLDKDRRVELIHYDALVSDPEEVFADLFDFLGLSFSKAIVRQVRATSIGKRPPPPIEDEVRSICEGLNARLMEARKNPVSATR